MTGGSRVMHISKRGQKVSCFRDWGLGLNVELFFFFSITLDLDGLLEGLGFRVEC